MNRTKEYDFTIVVPVYNEEDNLDRVEKELAGYLAECTLKACVLLVNDGSTDGSLGKIKDICSRRQHFFYISSNRNHGLSTALKAGIDTAESRYTGYIDSDLQTAPEDFNLLLAHIGDHDLVTGIRAKRKDSALKKLQSKIANGFRRAMTGDTATDTGCPLKVMRSDMAKRIPFFDGMHRFLPALFALEGGRFMELPVRHFPRTAGASKYHLWNRLAGPLVDCFAYRWMKARYIRYDITDESVKLKQGKLPTPNS